MQPQMLLFTQSKQVGFTLSITKPNWNKEDELYKSPWPRKYAIVAGTGPPVITKMHGNPISGRGYRHYLNHFLWNVRCPN